MVSAAVQLRWLLWKNWIVIKRRYIATPLEFLIPALIPIVFLLIRQRVSSSEVTTPTTWSECGDVCHFPTGVNFSSLKGLVYCPETNFTHSLMQKVIDRRHLNFHIAKGFASEEEMVDFIQFSNGTTTNTQFYAAGIVFTRLDATDNAFGWPTQIRYKIRLPATPRNRLKQNNEMNPFSADSNWRTQNVFPNPLPVGPRERSQNCSANPNYNQEGFTALQCAVGTSIIEMFNGSAMKADIVAQRQPFPPYYNDVFVIAIQQNFAIMLLLAFLCAMLNATSDVTSEREDKLKETLKMMGVSSSVQWLAWIIRYLVSSFIICFLQVLFYSIPTPGHPPVIPRSDPTLVFVFMLLSALASTAFAFMVSSFLSSASSASVATAILYLVSFAPYAFLQIRYGTVSLGVKMGIMLISTVAMGFGGLVIGDFESLGTGAQWSKIGVPASVDDELTMGYVFLMLIVDIILYCSIAFYVETVKPGEFGVPQPWYFPVMPSFWLPNLRQPSQALLERDSHISAAAPIPPYADRAWFESEERLLESSPSPIVQIRELTRKFGSAKTAVDSLSLDLYEGHITSLLGHNGSGKTTTMFMLTGFLAPTSGTAKIDGYDIRQASDLSKVRQTMGLCPQHDVLFRQLTVSEHLELFALLKGCSMDSLANEVESALSSVNLKAKQNEYARNMSGGQKRRLSVAIALIGGSKVVILDEPTSGLDPDARRSLWDVIERARSGRAILLTTHFLEEADALSDRIAVLSNGRLRCVGSPMFLKRTLGGGYRLSIEMASSGGSLKVLDGLVHSIVPSAVLWQQTLRNELLYTLPLNSSASFPMLMDELENKGPALGMESLGLTASSIEDVFVVAGIAQEFDENKSSQQPPTPRQDEVPLHSYDNNGVRLVPEPTGLFEDNAISNSSRENLTSADPTDGVYSHPLLFFVQLFALLLKNLIISFRSPVVLLTQLFVPLLFTAIAILVIKTIPGLTDAPALLLTPDHYDEPIISTFVDKSSSSSSSMEEAYRKAVTAYPVQYNLVSSDDYTSLSAYLTLKGKESLPDYRILYNLGAVFSTDRIVAFFNGDAYHSVAVSLGAVISGLFRSLPIDTGFIQTINHPLPPTPFERVSNQELEYTNGFIIAFWTMFGLSIYMGCCIIQPVGERMSNAKQLQMIAGASPTVYWLATFLFQLFLLLPSIGLIIGLFFISGMTAFTEGQGPGDFLLLLVLFFASAAPQNYLISWLFGQPSRALVWLILWNLMAAEVTILAVGILALPSFGLQDVGNVCSYIFMIVFPQFDAGQALSDYYANWVELSICDDPLVDEICRAFVMFNITDHPFPCCPAPYCGTECWTPTRNNLSFDGIGKYLVSMAGQAVVYSLILLLIDYRIFQRLGVAVKRCAGTFFNKNQSSSSQPLFTDDVNFSATQGEADDQDILAEKRQVDLLRMQSSCGGISEGLVVSNVIHRYSSSVLAVRGISFAVPPGSCFGLLGFNGAGKTTLYRIITADLMPTDGDVSVAGCSVRHSPTRAQSQLGYCPQAVGGVDGLLDQLTGRQQLLVMARLRGIRGNVNAYVDRLLDFMLLSRFADRPSHTYSGGMRRKLSTAVALIGRPPVILLDEPTTGMDPAARRQFWRIVDQLRRDGSTIILTSHSMDECDLLCDKLAVMVRGQLACIGSPSRLKTKYGGGMILIAKAPTSDGLQPMLRYIEANIVGAKLKDAHLGTASFTISYLKSNNNNNNEQQIAGGVNSNNNHNRKLSQAWSAMFGVLERGRTELGLIEDYSLSHTTLERVFLAFAGGSGAEMLANNDAAVVPNEPMPGNIVLSVPL